MSQHQAFRRVPVQPQFAQNARVLNIPPPTRGIIMDENEAFMRPGAAIVLDNWMPTMKGVKLRGGCLRWVDLHALDVPVPPIGDPLRKPVISAFEYQFGNNQRMYAAQQTKLFEVTTSGPPTLIKSGQTSGNYATAQMSNTGGQSVLTAVNDTGDPPLQYNGTTWTTLNGGQINGPAGTPVAGGANLVHVCKYRNRLYFVESNSMNVWYLGLDSIQGTLTKLPLSGSFAKGGKILFCADWSIDAGDGIDNKLVIASDLGEVCIFTGDPASASTWRQEGRYTLAPPLGMNAYFSMGGDLLILTVEGIIPLSQAITKTAEQLDLAALTRSIKPMWREEVIAKRAWSWTAERWDEYGGVFVTLPGGAPGKRMCLAANAATTAWARIVGWDATCFVRLRGDMFFGTQDGLIMQADRTGKDDGQPYVATLVGGWELLQTGAAEAVWHQARVSFASGNAEPFQPQIDATVDYVVTIPPPPEAGPDPGLADVWDQGLWDVAKWDQPSVARPPIRNTMWVSVGKKGFSHAPVLQVTIAQSAPPNVEVVAIAVTSERAGVTV